MTGHEVARLRRHPDDKRRPATMWTLTCECGWVKQWGFRTPLQRWHRDHAQKAGRP